MPLRLALLAALACLSAAASAAPAGAAERTGRHLVLVEHDAAARAASSAIARAGAHRAGRAVPRLGIVPVEGPAAAIRALRRQPGVARVVPEYRRELRRDPNDPAWSATETQARTPGPTPLQWWLRRERFREAWDITTGDGAVVAVIDTGLDGSHPELASRVTFGAAFGSTSPLQDDDGHGTHVSGLACAATDDGRGVASAGFGCRLIVMKAPEFRDGDIVQAIMLAADRGAHAISMSFGGGPTSPAIDRAGTGLGPQISMAAYGFFGGGADGPPGLVSTYPGHATPREVAGLGIAGCGCRTSVAGDNRYAYLQGTSMAVPQVAAAAAMVRDLNPDLTAQEVMAVLKGSARRTAGWEPDLGWGILDAYAAADTARRVDRTPPATVIRSRRRHTMDRRRYIRIRVRAREPVGHPGLVPSGVERVDIYAKRQGARGRYRRVRRLSRAGLARIRISRPGVYRFYTRAADESGNRERTPRRADLVTRVSR